VDAVFGTDDPTVAEPIPRAEEWIDLADAGPFIDETTLPEIGHNGNGHGHEAPARQALIAAEWVVARLSGLPGVGEFPQGQAATSPRSDTE
jgi:hypothetical protein